MSHRKQPTDVVQAELLTKCRRRCCMCYSLDRDNRQKKGQVAHIDRDSSNSSIENLAYLCLDHHNDYDSKMSQSKNYTPHELLSYKAELENYIFTEWNKPILNSEISVDVFSGRYSHSRENASADIEIKYIGGNVLQIQGMAFWGTEGEFGPNIGELDCIAVLDGNKAVFKDKFHDEEYVFEVTFLGSKISISDNNILGYYGNGVCFSGEYYKDATLTNNTQNNTEKIEVMNVAVYGCFIINENKKPTIDSTCDEINLVIQNSIKSANSKVYSYKNAILLHQAHIPETLFSESSYEKLNELIKQKIHDVAHLASIHFYSNEKDSKLHAIVNYNDYVLNYSAPAETVQKLSNRILNLNSLTRNESINISLNLFYLVYSQVHLDMMLEEKDYKNLHYTLDGCEKLALEVKLSCENLPIEYKLEMNEFLNFWLSHCERYRAVTLKNQKEYHGAVSCIFKAISFNPFYPYVNYSSLKADYSKRYAVELVPGFNEMQELFPEIDVTAEENLAVAAELSQQIEFKEVSYNYMILKDIMYENQDDQDLINYIEKELDRLDNNSPFILITKSEIIRFLKKGKKRINAMYASRLDDTIEYLRKAITLDSDLPVLYTKIGSLLLMKGIHMSSPKSINEGIEMYKKGAHFLVQLGFRMRPKSTK